MDNTIAIAIDVSSSIVVTPNVFTVGENSKRIDIQLEEGGTPTEPINELAKKYDKVYYFTDGCVNGVLADNVVLIKTE